MMAALGHAIMFTFKFNFSGGNSGLCQYFRIKNKDEIRIELRNVIEVKNKVKLELDKANLMMARLGHTTIFIFIFIFEFEIENENENENENEIDNENEMKMKLIMKNKFEMKMRMKMKLRIK